MTIPELAERIDQRVAAQQHEIDRLEAAKRALAPASTVRLASSTRPSRRRWAVAVGELTGPLVR